jgi:hypothetical protein
MRSVLFSLQIIHARDPYHLKIRLFHWLLSANITKDITFFFLYLFELQTEIYLPQYA